MSGLISILNISNQAMLATQAGIQVTSHNIANVNTPGYARQRAIYQSSDTFNSIGGMLIGHGVQVAQIKQLEDQFLNQQVLRNTMTLGYLSTSSSGLNQLEEVFNESEEGGLSYNLNNLFASLQDLANKPDGQTQRIAVRSSAQSVISEFHRISKFLADIRKSNDTDIKSSIQQVNRIATEIANLNTKILDMEAAGQTANDYRSTRSALMEELSEYADYSYFEDDRGMMTIMVSGGQPLVEGHRPSKFVGVENASNDGLFDVYFEDSNGNRTNITESLKEGRIKGTLDIRDDVSLDLMERLDELAYTMINSFNAIHSTGYNLNGDTGVNFFQPVVQDGAARNIALTDEILNDVNNIAAGQSTDPGDNRNALALAGLQDDLLLNGGTWTFSDFYGAIVGEVGTTSRQATESYDHQKMVLDQAVNYRESIVGVSIDEEMATLVELQETYTAMAKLFNSITELIDILMSLKQ